MSIPFFRRLSVLLLLVLALTVPRATAAGQSRDVRQPEMAAQAAPADLLGHLWSFLANLWLKSGCYIDPDGRCAPQTAAPASQRDEGCYIDPSGRCAPHLTAPPVLTPQRDEGCYIDPNGRCLH
jgi:hypothetical protein